jgi:hypothetical protein
MRLPCLLEALSISTEPTDRAFVYTNLVRVLAKAKKEKEFKGTLKDALAWINQHNLPQYRIDIYMGVGDVNWLEKDGKKEAAKTFAAALLEAILSAPTDLAPIAMHIVGRIISIDESERDPFVQELEAYLRKIVRKWCNGESWDRPLGIALWPYKVAKRLSEYPENSLSSEKASAIYLEQLEVVFSTD